MESVFQIGGLTGKKRGGLEVGLRGSTGRRKAGSTVGLGGVSREGRQREAEPLQALCDRAGDVPGEMAVLDRKEVKIACLCLFSLCS